MYSPRYNWLEDREELVAFMREHSFVVLVTGTDGDLRASHLPALVIDDAAELVLEMHMARANDHWRLFGDSEAMVIFLGPHGYISPRWYAETERVPTWNYATAHAFGVPQITEDKRAKLRAQRRLVAALDPEWLPSFDALHHEYVDRMLDGIVTFQIVVRRVETRSKLSQNRGAEEMGLIASALEASGEIPLALLTRDHIKE